MPHIHFTAVLTPQRDIAVDCHIRKLSDHLNKAAGMLIEQFQKSFPDVAAIWQQTGQTPQK